MCTPTARLSAVEITPVDLTGKVLIDKHENKPSDVQSYIYKALYEGEAVAVKILTRQGRSETTKQTRQEIAVWASKKHANICPVLGLVYEENFGPVGALILSWYEKGDASRYLLENGQRMLVADRIALWRGVVEGIVYLHKQNKPVVHGDLRPGNILISDTGVPMLCDFGLGRVLPDEARNEMARGGTHPATIETEQHVRYLAPEQVSSKEMVYSTASDVYALGCLGLEFIYRQLPYATHSTTASILDAINNALPPAMEPDVHDWPAIMVWPSLLKCWNREPSLRPVASSLLDTLNHTASLTEPINLTGQISVDKDAPEFKGNLSFIFMGRYNSKKVAIKVLKEAGNVGTMKRKINREMTIWANVTHQNILPFYGYANDQAFNPFGAFISPWCHKGDASAFLDRNKESISIPERIKLWKGAIDGIVYLHTRVPPIVHGDLKPKNILIDDADIPVLCDFGLAHIHLEAGSTGMTTLSEFTGTERYLAPELVSSEENVYPTAPCDMYALGCIGLEFVYLQKPYCNRRHNKYGHIVGDLKRGVPPAVEMPPSPDLPEAWMLLLKLWQQKPSDRPTALDAAGFFNSHVLSFTSRDT